MGFRIADNSLACSSAIVEVAVVVAFSVMEVWIESQESRVPILPFLLCSTHHIFSLSSHFYLLELEDGWVQRGKSGC